LQIHVLPPQTRHRTGSTSDQSAVAGDLHAVEFAKLQHRKKSSRSRHEGMSAEQRYATQPNFDHAAPLDPGSRRAAIVNSTTAHQKER
jgi:hypothetical protein